VTSQLIEVPRIETSSTFRTLVARISPSGDMKATIIYLCSQTVTFAGCIATSSLDREAAYWAFWQYFRPKVGFSTPVLSLTYNQCVHIQVPAIQATLSKLHLNRNTSRAIVFGPDTYGGLGLPDLYTSTGINQLRLLLGHLRLQDKTAKLILIDISYLFATIHRILHSILQFAVQPIWCLRRFRLANLHLEIP
jgi:hypothetical protein